MSERERLRMTDDEVEKLIDECWRLHVATHNSDGSIHLVPLTYMRFDDHLAFWTDPASRKIRNLRRDPRITCLIETGDSFEEYRALQITGTVHIIDDPETSCRAGEALFGRFAPLDDQLKAYVASLAPLRVAVLVRPTRMVSWDHRKLAGSGHKDIGS